MNKRKRNTKDVEMRLMSELMQNSHRSDRELARAIHTSQPTVSRIRTRLEKTGLIRDYTVSPDIGKLGIELVAVTFANWSPQQISEFSESERVQKAKDFLAKHPNVVFASSGNGLGMGRIMVTVHKDYADYANYIMEARSEWAGLLDRFETFVISLNADIVTAPFSLRNLGEYIDNQRKK